MKSFVMEVNEEGLRAWKALCRMKIEDDDGDEFCFHCHSNCFCCLIRMDLINFLDVLHSSLLVGEIVAVAVHWEIHFSAERGERGRKEKY